MTGLRKISGNNKHSVVLSSDIKEASFVTQTLTSHHVCNRGGFFCLQISSHSRIMRVREWCSEVGVWQGFPAQGSFRADHGQTETTRNAIQAKYPHIELWTASAFNAPLLVFAASVRCRLETR